MSYEKYTWENGEVITKEKLNHIENGIEGASSGGIFIVEKDPEKGASATFDEMLNAINDGKLLVLKNYSMPKQYGNQFYMYHLAQFFDYHNDGDLLIFKGIQTIGSGYSVITITCSRTNQWDYSQHQIVVQ